MTQVSGANEVVEAPGADEPLKIQANGLVSVNFPKDAVDEWPAPKQIHSFYFVKYRPYEDPKLKIKIDQADKDLHRKNQDRFQITEKLRSRRADRAQVISQLKALGGEDRQFRMVMDERRREMEPLQQALGKLRTSKDGGRDRGFGLCSSEEELDRLIESLNDRIQHESISLNEEKQLVREIKQLEGTREKVIANAAMRAKIEESLGQKEDIQDQVKLMGVDLDGVRKEQQGVRGKIRSLEDELKVIDNNINSLQQELAVATERREKASENFQKLRKQREEANSHFYQNRTLLNKAKELAATKNLAALTELCHAEVEAFMSQWNNKAFRDDYERRILSSLNNRQLSSDGRMRNPDEKPVVAVDQTEVEATVKTNVSKPRSEPEKTRVEPEKLTVEAKRAQVKPDKSRGGSELESPPKESSKEVEVDPVKVKEMKREEEIAKAKMASERKKKLAERAATKAAARAQKETEKKLKEREKKAKKKASSAGAVETTDLPTEQPAEPVEQEATDEIEPLLQIKTSTHENGGISHRRQPKGPDSRRKLVVKRKKSSNYWIYAVPATFLVILLLGLGYHYLIS